MRQIPWAKTHRQALTYWYQTQKNPVGVLASKIGMPRNQLTQALKIIEIHRTPSEGYLRTPSNQEFYETHGQVIIKMYVEDQMGTGLIAKKLSTNKDRIRRYLIWKNIPLRHGSEAVACQWKHDDGTRSEAASTFAKQILAPASHLRQTGVPNPKASERMKLKNPVHDPKVVAKIVATKKERGLSFKGKKNPGYGKNYRSSREHIYRGGCREDLGGIYFRSSWASPS